VAVLVGGAPRVQAVPSFSRELKTECTTCHTIFPQRNEFGQAFEKNAFVWPGAAKSKKAKLPQTEEERKSAEFVSLSGIPAVVPLSVLLGANWVQDATAEDDFDMKRYSAALFAAGVFGGNKVGFWFSESLGSQSGGPTGPSEVFLVAREPLGAPLNVKAGRFSPDLSLWRGSDHLIGRPLSMAASVDGFAMAGAQSGLEVSVRLGPRVEAVFGVNDRNNNTSTAAPTPHSVNDYYARVGGKIGGADYRGKEPDVDLDADSVWDYLSISLGGFAYRGSTSDGTGVDRDLTRFGLEAGAGYRKLLVMLGATIGENDRDGDDPTGSTAFSAEVNYVLNATFALALRYDSLDVDDLGLRTLLTPGITWAPLQSFKVRLTAARETAAVDKTTATLSASLSF